MKSLFKFIDRTLKVSILLIILCSMASCNNYKAEDLSKIKNKVVFVEEHTRGDGLYSGNFGDVVIMDLESKKKYKLTNDDFYDEDPHFSHDGKFIYFQSSRSGSKMTRMLSGIGGPYSTCILVINSGEISKIDFEKDRPENLRTSLSCMQLTSDNSHLYFNAFPAMILRSTIKGDSLKIIRDYSQDEKAGFTIMRDLKLSNDDKYLAFYYEDRPLEGNDVTPKGKGLGIFDLKNSKLKLIPTPYINSVFCWTQDSKKILLENGGKVISYDIKEDRSYVLVDASKSNLVIKNCVINEKKLIFLAAKDGEQIGNYEIVQYDLNTQKYEWITNDGLQKDFLDVYSETDGK